MSTRKNTQTAPASRHISYEERRRVASQIRSEFLLAGLVFVRRSVFAVLGTRVAAPGAGRILRKA